MSVMQNEQVNCLRVQEIVEAFQTAGGLSAPFAESYVQWYAGVVQHLAGWARTCARPPIIGVSGCQGSGKSTLATLMAQMMCQLHGVATVVLSLDDFYLTKEERWQIAADIHPLFMTRGVPGTHDVPLLLNTIEQLRAGDRVSLPLFDKASDDRAAIQRWRTSNPGTELIILEGWCVGLSPQPTAQLATPVNDLEREQDADLVWRKAINQQLSGPYATLWAELDALLFLQAPHFDAVPDWRWEQEQQLSAQHQLAHTADHDPTMSRDDVVTFVSHYQRLTEHALVTLPQQADYLWALDEDRSVSSLRIQAGGTRSQVVLE
jgi:D-glycerate 3-kinase